MSETTRPHAPGRIGRYLLGDALGRGGQAAVFFALAVTDDGVKIPVALKLVPSDDPDLVRVLTEEARLLARLAHGNVVAPIDVVRSAPPHPGVGLVTTWIDGASLAELLAAVTLAKRTVALPIAARITCDVLAALAAAHEAKDETGESRAILHRDVSPDNVLVGIDGIARLIDFGIAKAAESARTTTLGLVKGKPAYLAPERLVGEAATPKTDLYAVARVLAEVLGADVRASRELPPNLPNDVRDILRRATNADPESRRPDTARAFAAALERATPLASSIAVGDWVRETAADLLAQRRRARSALLLSPAAVPVSAGAASGRASRGPLAIAFVVGAAVAGVVGGGLAAVRAPSIARESLASSVAAPLAASATSAPSPAASLASGPVASSAPPPVASPARSLSAATASASAIAEPPPVASVARGDHRPHNAVASPAATRPSGSVAKKVSCDPAWTVDASGHVIFKRECLADAGR